MADLSPEELARYSRHILLDEIGVAGQQRLKQARILVVGAGGLGSPAALYLAAAGVGTLGIVDFDRVETHNLQRQLLHSDARVRTSKVSSAGHRLRETNPLIQIKEHDFAVDCDNAINLFSQYDVILDGTDSFAMRYLNNDAAVLAKRPLVYGSVFKFEGSVSVFAPHAGGPCYRCLFPEPPPPGSVPNCGEAGVMGAVCGVIGSLQALEAIKWCVGFGESLLGRLLTYDGLNQTFRTLHLARDPHCPTCGKIPKITRMEPARYGIPCSPVRPTPSIPLSRLDHANPPLEVSVEEADQLLRDQPGRVALIDVREPYEAEICQIAGARLIPMREMPSQLTTLPTDCLLLIQCHHGGRSLRVTEFLRRQGFPQTSNIAGGIDAWAVRIDPSLRRY